MTGNATYILGSDTVELARLQRQHGIWQDAMQASWQRAGFGLGQRLLDLGCGPGFASLELAALVGGQGQVLAIDSAPAFLSHLQQRSQQLGLQQLQLLQHDLATGPAPALGAQPWDGAWCRWVAMFLPKLEPLLDLLEQGLRPGGRLVLHEYVRWDTFALMPRGELLRRFVQSCIALWRDHGGDPDVGQRLPGLLEQRGFRLLHCESLMACCTAEQPKARWLQDFVRSYGPQLQAAGRWSAAEQSALDAELHWAQQHPSLWVTPALVAMIWEHP